MDNSNTETIESRQYNSQTTQTTHIAIHIPTQATQDTTRQ